MLKQKKHFINGLILFVMGCGLVNIWQEFRYFFPFGFFQPRWKKYWDLGDSWDLANSYSKAIDNYTKALKFSPPEETLELIYYSRGECFYKLEKYYEAIADFDFAEQKGNHSYDLYFYRGTAFLHLEEWEKAITHFNLAIDVNETSQAYNNRGIAFKMLEKFDRAMKNYDRAIELNPCNWNAYVNRSSLFGTMCHYQLAVENLSCAITLNPYCDRLYYDRADLFRRWRKLSEAIDDYNRALFLAQQDKDRAHIYNDRGYAFFIKGETTQAIEDYNRAITLDPTLALPYFNSGEAFATLGEIRSAISCYFQAANFFQNLNQVENYDRSIAAIKKLSR